MDDFFDIVFVDVGVLDGFWIDDYYWFFIVMVYVVGFVDVYFVCFFYFELSDVIFGVGLYFICVKCVVVLFVGFMLIVVEKNMVFEMVYLVFLW